MKKKKRRMRRGIIGRGQQSKNVPHINHFLKDNLSNVCWYRICPNRSRLKLKLFNENNSFYYINFKLENKEDNNSKKNKNKNKQIQ